MKTTIILTLFTTIAIANPLTKRWVCGGEPPSFACQPKEGCKSEMAWADCATKTGLEGCGDPLPDQTVPVSPCQSSAFTTCEQQHC